MLVHLLLAADGTNSNNTEIMVSIGTGSAGILAGLAALVVAFRTNKKVDRHVHEDGPDGEEQPAADQEPG